MIRSCSDAYKYMYTYLEIDLLDIKLSILYISYYKENISFKQKYWHANIPCAYIYGLPIWYQTINLKKELDTMYRYKYYIVL